MRKGKVVAAAFVALGFVFVSFVLLVVERRMGLTSVADFFDPAKVLVGLASPVWLIGDLIYLGFGLALAYLTTSSEDRILRATGLIAAAGFVFIGCLGQVAKMLPSLIADSGHVETALLGLLPVRLAALRTTVLALGIFAWRTTRDRETGQSGPVAWRALGYLVLAASVAFLFVFLPIPVLFAIWALWLTIREARSA